MHTYELNYFAEIQGEWVIKFVWFHEEKVPDAWGGQEEGFTKLYLEV